MDKVSFSLWVQLKEYILSKNSHGKNELLNKMYVNSIQMRYY